MDWLPRFRTPPVPYAWPRTTSMRRQAGNTITQDPSNVGKGSRTIALRLTGTEYAKEQLQEMGEDVDDFIVTTTAKMEQSIRDLTKVQDGFGISILDANGNYRSTYEILLDIAKIWDQIAEENKITVQNRQNALLEMMAGKNRANILASILQSPKVLEDAYKAALDSTGSTQEELEKYLDSVTGKTTELQNQLQELSYVKSDSDFFKKMIDSDTGAVTILTQIIDMCGTLPTLLTTIAGALSLKNVGRPKLFGFINSKYADSHKCSLGY